MDSQFRDDVVAYYQQVIGPFSGYLDPRQSRDNQQSRIDSTFFGLINLPLMYFAHAITPPMRDGHDVMGAHLRAEHADLYGSVQDPVLLVRMFVEATVMASAMMAARMEHTGFFDVGGIEPRAVDPADVIDYALARTEQIYLDMASAARNNQLFLDEVAGDKTLGEQEKARAQEIRRRGPQPYVEHLSNVVAGWFATLRASGADSLEALMDAVDAQADRIMAESADLATVLTNVVQADIARRYGSSPLG